MSYNKFIIFLTLSVFIILSACSKGKESQSTQAVTPSQNSATDSFIPTSGATIDKFDHLPTMSSGVVKYFNVTPDMPRVGDTISVIPVLEGPDVNVTLRYEWQHNDSILPETSSSLKLTDRFKKGDKIKCTVTYGSKKWFVNATVFNSSPIFVSEPIVKRQNENKFTITAKAVDPDGDKITYSFKHPLAAAVINPDTGVIELDLTGASAGVVNFTIAATDGSGGEGLYNMTMSLQ